MRHQERLQLVEPLQATTDHSLTPLIRGADTWIGRMSTMRQRDVGNNIGISTIRRAIPTAKESLTHLDKTEGYHHQERRIICTTHEYVLGGTQGYVRSIVK